MKLVNAFETNISLYWDCKFKSRPDHQVASILKSMVSTSKHTPLLLLYYTVWNETNSAVVAQMPKTRTVQFIIHGRKVLRSRKPNQYTTEI